MVNPKNIVKFRINGTLHTGEVGNLAYRGAENVSLFLGFTINRHLVGETGLVPARHCTGP